MTTSVDEIFPSSTQPLGDARRTEGGNKAFHNFYNDYSHVADPNLRRRLALSEIDKIPFGLYRMSPWNSTVSRCFSASGGTACWRIDVLTDLCI